MALFSTAVRGTLSRWCQRKIGKESTGSRSPMRLPRRLLRERLHLLTFFNGAALNGFRRQSRLFFDTVR